MISHIQIQSFPKVQSSLLSWILYKDQATALDACIKKNHTTAAQEELKLTCLVIFHCNWKVKGRLGATFSANW